MKYASHSFIFFLLIVLTQCSSAQESEEGYHLTVDQTSLPFQFVDNRIFLELSINGKKGHFILDTGGIYGMNDAFAKSMDLDTTSTFTMAGAGSEQVPGWRTTVQHVKVGGLSVSNASFVVIDLEPMREYLHLPFADGVVGAELFRRYVVDINYPARTVTFIKPDAFHPEENWKVIPFTFHQHLPMIDGALLHHTGKFMIDTGDRSMLTIFKNYADSTGLRKKVAFSDTVATGYGIGGPIYARTALLNTFTLAHDIQIDSVTMRVPTLTTGAFARSTIAGSIGSGMLKRYRVIFNYGEQKLYLARSL